MKQEKQKREGREQMQRRILDAAKSLFVEEGFGNVSMRRLASAIEYSPAAIYRYFGSKREILSTLRNEGFQHFLNGQKERMSAYPDPLERLREGARWYIRFAMNEPDYYHLMFCTDTREVDLEGELAAISLTSFDLYRSTIHECVETGRFGDITSRTVAFALWSSMHGLAELLHSGRFEIMYEDQNIDRIVEEIIEFNLRPTAQQK